MKCKFVKNFEGNDLTFILNEIYDYRDWNNNFGDDEYVVSISNRLVWFTSKEFNEFFIDISEYRDKQIGDLLDEV